MTMGLQKALAAVLAAICMMSGCGTPPDDGAEPSGTNTPEAALTIEKAELAHRMAWEYQADHARPEVQKPPFAFSRENFPQIAVTVSGEPLARSAAARLLGEDGERVSDLIRTGTAAEACKALMDGRAGVVLTAEPDRAVWDAKEAAGFDWEMTPAAVDALVFVVNADNPVENLTGAQVRDLYAGKITNWKEVGGADAPVTVLGRGEGSGCRTALLNLVMDGAPVTDEARTAGTMAELAEAVRTTGGAVGCASWYCADRLYAGAGWKTLSIDGVSPSADTIRSGAYPFLNNLYVLTAAGGTGAAHALYDWFRGAEGRQLAAREGYIPAGETGGAA